MEKGVGLKRDLQAAFKGVNICCNIFDGEFFTSSSLPHIFAIFFMIVLNNGFKRSCMCSDNTQLFILETSRGRRKLAIGLYDFETARFLFFSGFIT